MNLSGLDLGLWAAVAISNTALLSVLLIRGRWRIFVVFSSLTGFDIAKTLLLYFLYQQGLWEWYKHVYWTGALLDFALQMGVIWEIVRIVLRPNGNWDREVRQQLILWSAVGIVLAAALAWMTNPPAANFLGVLRIRGNMFTSVLVCELLVLIVRTSNHLGLGWRNHVSALVYGWSAWAFVEIVVEWLHGSFGAKLYFNNLEYVSKVVGLFALGYWIIQFWFDEPLSKPIPPELRESMLDLHSQIKNDLDKVNAQR